MTDEDEKLRTGLTVTNLLPSNIISKKGNSMASETTLKITERRINVKSKTIFRL